MKFRGFNDGIFLILKALIPVEFYITFYISVGLGLDS
jgi:hypothetical protein